MTARLLVLAALLFPAFAAAETIVTSSVDRDTITVGDRVLLTIRVDAPAGTDSLLPVFPDPVIGPFEILETFPVETKTLDGVRTDVARFAITAFETGDLEIPSIKPAGGEGEGSAPIGIAIRSIGLDPAGEIRDLKGPVALGRRWGGPLILLSLALLLAAAAVYLYLRWRRREILVDPVLGRIDLGPAHHAALEELNRLDDERRRRERTERQDYFRLSGIVREYIDRRYALPAPERTTREILKEIREEHLETETTGILRELLRRCDLVKFRGTLPDDSEWDEAALQAREFIGRTRESEPGKEEENR